MKCNTDFLIVAYIVSLFVDWVFQSQWQAMNKSKWSKTDNREISFLALLSHSVIYAMLTTGIVTMIFPQINSTLVANVLLVSHFIIDTRIPVKHILKLKGMTDEQIGDTLSYGFMHIGIDHRLHELTLLVLSFFV